MSWSAWAGRGDGSKRPSRERYEAALGDRLVYQVVRAGRTLEVPVTLRRAEVADRLLQWWGTILFVVALFVVVAYLYARRPGPATAALLVSGSGLLSSDHTLSAELLAVAEQAPDPAEVLRCCSARAFRATIATGASPFRAGGDARPSSARDQTRRS